MAKLLLHFQPCVASYRYAILFRYYTNVDISMHTNLYKGCRASIWPPALTISWCPLDHRRSLLVTPVFFLHISDDVDVASFMIVGLLVIKWCIPVVPMQIMDGREIDQHHAHRIG